MRNNQPTIALDTDGVTLDFVPTWHRVAEQVLGRNLKEMNPASYSMHKKLNITKAEGDLVWAEFYRNGSLAQLAPVPGAVEAVIELKLHYNLVAVTAIDPVYTKLCEQNLADHGMAMPVVAVGMSGCKRETLHRIRPILYVDDMVHHLKTAPTSTHVVWLNTGLEQIVPWDDVVDTHYPDLLTWLQKNPNWVKILQTASST